MSRMFMIVIGMLYYTTSLFDGLDYEMTRTQMFNKNEAIYTLEVDTSKEQVKVENGFSFGVLYGFETTSKMVEREGGAICAVNGMFYEDFGLPMGMIVHDYIPVQLLDIGTPMLVISDDGQVDLEDMTMYVDVSVNGESIEVFGINGRVPTGEWGGVFSPLFGSTTRIRRYSTNYIIEDDTITDVVRSDSPIKLTSSSYVLSYVGEDSSYGIGDKVEVDLVTDYTEFTIEEAFQTGGGWLVNDGINVANDYEAFVGYTTAPPQPRTLVGITEDEKLVFVVVDGRDKEWSLGMSGKEAADLMISKGCIEAAYLDGGASSTMYVDGEVVNRPSGGEERAIAHSILIKVDK